MGLDDAPVELRGDALENDADGHWSASTFFASIAVRPTNRTVVTSVSNFKDSDGIIEAIFHSSPSLLLPGADRALVAAVSPGFFMLQECTWAKRKLGPLSLH